MLPWVCRVVVLIAVDAPIAVVRDHLKVEVATSVLRQLEESDRRNVDSSLQHGDEGHDEKNREDADLERALLPLHVRPEVLENGLQRRAIRLLMDLA